MENASGGMEQVFPSRPTAPLSPFREDRPCPGSNVDPRARLGRKVHIVIYFALLPVAYVTHPSIKPDGGYSGQKDDCSHSLVP